MQDNGLVFTTAYGTPYEPRNFARHFARTRDALRRLGEHLDG